MITSDFIDFIGHYLPVIGFAIAIAAVGVFITTVGMKRHETEEDD